MMVRGLFTLGLTSFGVLRPLLEMTKSELFKIT